MMRAMTVTYLDGSLRWHRGRLTAERPDGELRLEPAPTFDDVDLRDGVITGGFTDWHVHLHLIDVGALAGGPLVRVHDLGGVPAQLRATQTALGVRSGLLAGSGDGSAPPSTLQTLHVLHAGAFLTPPGGYPADRAWAPPASVREVADTSDARQAVREMVAAGASAIKVASNSEAGPVFSDETFRAIVREATHAGVPVVAHAEGRGEAMRVARLGAQILAHAPFTEPLSDPDLAALARTTTWISTLDIHGWGDYGREHQIASANVAGFVRHGGALRYGTDMGNGPTVIGLNPRELASLEAAGLTPDQQLAALSPADPLAPNARLMWVPRTPGGALDVAAARPFDVAKLALGR